MYYNNWRYFGCYFHIYRHYLANFAIIGYYVTMTEADFQRQVIQFLKKHGCFVMKTTPGPGVPKGTADILFCKEGFYGWLECKQAKNSKHQPGQDQFISKMDEWSYAKFVWPGEQWEKVQKELEFMLR